MHDTAEFSGDADRVSMRPAAHGERLGFASGKAGAPVRFRQRGDRPGEWSEGEAERVEYDGVANEVRLIGTASLRALAGTVVTPSVASDAVPYDIARDLASATEAERRALPAAARAHRTTVTFAPQMAR